MSNAPVWIFVVIGDQTRVMLELLVAESSMGEFIYVGVVCAKIPPLFWLLNADHPFEL